MYMQIIVTIVLTNFASEFYFLMYKFIVIVDAVDT